MNSLLTPQGIPGINAHPLPELPTGAATWQGTRTLLVCDDLRTWLPVGTVAEMTAALERWAEAVVSAGEDTVLAVHPGAVATPAHVLALAEGTRAPYVEVDGEPSAHPPVEPAAARFEEVLRQQLTEGTAPSRVTKAWGLADAVTAFERATAGPAGLGPEDAAAVRAASAAAVRRVEAVVRIVGPREPLLWPLPAPTGATLPMAEMVGVALDVLRAAGERRPVPFAAGPEIDRLEQELIAGQRRLDERRATTGTEPRR